MKPRFTRSLRFRKEVSGLVTLQDCLDMMSKCFFAIIEDGEVSGFKAEKSPTDGREPE